MKKEFIGFYKPTEEEKNEAWNNGTFIFDTNALLNLYRYSKKTRDDFLTSLEKIKERIFLPYQVALEFHKNRHSVIENSNSKYESLIEDIQGIFKKSIDQHFNQVKKHPSINIKPLQKLSDSFIQDLKKELNKQKREHPDYHNDDHTLDKLIKIFDNKIGKPFTEEEIESLCKDGKVRYEKKIPPGYKDFGNKSNKNEFGDLIVWKEIIKYTKENKQPIIFVTDDQKEDWWTIEKGIPIRPREELIKEFFDETGIRILIYNADRFLRAAKKRKLVETIDDKSLDELLNFSKVKFYGGGDPILIKKNNRINNEIMSEWLINHASDIDRFRLKTSDLGDDKLPIRFKSYIDYINFKNKEQEELIRKLGDLNRNDENNDNFELV